MKFFSNEAAKENEHDREERRDDATHVASDPVTVPQQRPGSPWSDAPGTPDAESRDRTAGEPDGTVAATTTTEAAATTYGPDGSVTRTEERVEEHRDAALKDDGGFDSPTAVNPATGEDLDRKDTDKPAEDTDLKDDGGFDSPTAVNPATGEDLDRKDTDKPAEDTALKDDGGFDGPTVVEPATGEPLDEPGEREPEEKKEAEPVAVAAAAPVSERLLPDGDRFTERFRDVQLRFVDSPKEATAEAAGLVREVIDQLTSNLRSQQDALASNSDDTEKLRVELRSYRDVLNRLLSL